MINERERKTGFSEKDQERYNAVFAIASLFDLAHMAYVLGIQKYGVCQQDAERQMERYQKSSPSERLEMLKHIETVMKLDADFAEEIGPQVQRIKDVLGIEWSSTIA